MIVAVEQSVKAVVGLDEVEHLGLGERPTGPYNFEARFRQQVMVRARGVLITGGGKQDTHRKSFA